MDNVIPLRHDMSRPTPRYGGGGALPDAVALHLRYLQLCGAMPDTVICRRNALARMTRALPVPLLAAGPAELLDWRAALTVDPATVVAYVSHARGFYAWAFAQGRRDDNPAEGLPVPKLGRRLPRPIGEEDLFQAIAGAPPRIRPWLVLAGWCGLRAKEIALLRRECVLETARPPVLIVAGDATKGRNERMVPMHSFVVAELVDAGLPGSGWIFRRRDGQRGPNKPWLVSQLCNAYLHESGIRATLHQLRHRFGTMTYAQRRDLRMVQELMGHSNPKSTAVYADVDQADAAVVIEGLPAPGRLRAIGELCPT
jgi:integrase